MSKSNEQAKLRMRRYRNKSVTNDSVTGESVTYPAIVRALTDPVKRDKLTRIVRELNRHRLLPEVRYGIEGPTFDKVSKLLEIT